MNLLRDGTYFAPGKIIEIHDCFSCPHRRTHASGKPICGRVRTWCRVDGIPAKCPLQDAPPMEGE